MVLRKRNRKIKNRLIIIGSLFLLSGLSLITYDYLSNKKIEEEKKDAINNFYQEKETIEIDLDNDNQVDEDITIEEFNYIGVIKIPKISLERGLVNPYSYQNNVDKNIAFVEPYTLPDKQYGNVILASHSGNSSVSFFRKLDKLSINDEVSIDYKGHTYTYKVVNIYDIDKTGKAQIFRNKNTNTLTLVTCRHNTEKQIIIICELSNTN